MLCKFATIFCSLSFSGSTALRRSASSRLVSPFSRLKIVLNFLCAFLDKSKAIEYNVAGTGDHQVFWVPPQLNSKLQAPSGQNQISDANFRKIGRLVRATAYPFLHVSLIVALSWPIALVHRNLFLFKTRPLAHIAWLKLRPERSPMTPSFRF